MAWGCRSTRVPDLDCSLAMESLGQLVVARRNIRSRRHRCPRNFCCQLCIVLSCVNARYSNSRVNRAWRVEQDFLGSLEDRKGTRRRISVALPPCSVERASYAVFHASVCRLQKWLGQVCCQPNSPLYHIGRPAVSIDFLDRCPVYLAERTATIPRGQRCFVPEQ